MQKLTLITAAISASSAVALCHAAPDMPVVALNFELPADGQVPEWIELLPAGQTITGRDGRFWKNADPAAVIARSRQLGQDIPLDIEHATELKAPKGEPAPAVGWITDMEIRDGAIWGQVSWNDAGREAVAGREYRYLSPVFPFHKTSREIYAITSVALTNKPNLHLSALNRAQSEEENTVNEFLKALCAALGLATDLDLETKEGQDKALNALQKLKADHETALNQAQHPSLDKFVPRGDYDKALNRADELDAKLKERDQAELEGKIKTAINTALQAGKIVPASVEYHTAQCRQEGGLELFNKFIEGAPVIADPSDLDNRNPADKDTALNREQQQMADLFGNSAEDLAKYSA